MSAKAQPTVDSPPSGSGSDGSAMMTVLKLLSEAAVEQGKLLERVAHATETRKKPLQRKVKCLSVERGWKPRAGLGLSPNKELHGVRAGRAPSDKVAPFPDGLEVYYRPEEGALVFAYTNGEKIFIPTDAGGLNWWCVE